MRVHKIMLEYVIILIKKRHVRFNPLMTLTYSYYENNLYLKAGIPQSNDISDSQPRGAHAFNEIKRIKSICPLVIQIDWEPIYHFK